VVDPLQDAGAGLRLQLEANGIAVAGHVRRGAIPPTATEILSYRGKPLGEIVRLLMKYSNNCIAETLLKGLAVRSGTMPGSWPAGISAMHDKLVALGVDTNGLTLLDGSGLAAANRVTPRSLVDALRVARRSFDYGPEFVAALPIAAPLRTAGKRRRASVLDPDQRVSLQRCRGHGGGRRVCRGIGRHALMR
jgi:D-alanyl-D-alanine carboxypeptidase/D-alanyl-D-alanine-endopeptidase (penicillin-binding protein 4)